jgi:16S rRNA G966 N2-methylase RsmD
VFDPFAGSGTTALEALKLGRRAVLSDRISACVMISNAKTTLLTTRIKRRLKAEILAALTWQHQCRSNAVGTNGEGSDPKLKSWYTPGTLSQLRYLWLLLEKQTNPDLRRVMTLIFSDVLFACASPGKAETTTGKRRRHHWGWVADNVHPKTLVEHNAIEAFETGFASLPDQPITCNHAADALILQQDTKQLALASETVDLVVTSPPYIGVIDYTRANRLLYAWMGWQFDLERHQEIGARFKRQRVQMVGEYLGEMLACWSEIHRVVRRGGYCAIVIGESRRYPGTVGRTLHDLKEFMPCIWGPISRIPSRRRVSERGAREAVEYLCVFQKQ